jgi:hypothetical protein
MFSYDNMKLMITKPAVQQEGIQLEAESGARVRKPSIHPRMNRRHPRMNRRLSISMSLTKCGLTLCKRPLNGMRADAM